MSTNETLQNGSNPQCSPAVYSGSVCRLPLQSLQNCIPDLCGSTEIYISSDSMQSVVEEQLTLLLGGLRFLSPSTACLEAAEPFLCAYYFNLCDGGELYRPSFEDCVTIASETCRDEFEAAVRFGMSERLPRCELLSTSESPSSKLELGCSGESAIWRTVVS